MYRVIPLEEDTLNPADSKAEIEKLPETNIVVVCVITPLPEKFTPVVGYPPVCDETCVDLSSSVVDPFPLAKIL